MMKKRILSLLLALCLVGACTTANAAAQYKYDPENPYVGGIVGIFHNLPVTTADDGEQIGQYSAYLPDGMEPWNQVILLLTPDNTTAEAFTQSELGRKWLQLADDNSVAVIFAEPLNGKTWNNAKDPAGRDEAEMLSQTFNCMRVRNLAYDAAFSMDSRGCSLVGYGEGGAAAAIFGMERSSHFCDIAVIGAPEISMDSLNAAGDAYCVPWGITTMAGIEENAYPSKRVPVPIWFIDSAQGNAEPIAYYVNANGAEPVKNNAYTDAFYQNPASAASVWVTDGEKADALTEQILWDAFLGHYKRYMNMTPGGRLAYAEDFSREGYVVTEAKIDGFPRKWLTYVPASYDGSAEVPLILCMHGYACSMYQLAQESRLFEVADEHGVIVVWPQALVFDSHPESSIPLSTWNAGVLKSENGPDDVAFLTEVVQRTKENYNIDAGRVYATGHSNGSMMTWTVGLGDTTTFAAIAPIGAMISAENMASADCDAGVLLPAWGFLGEYENGKLATNQSVHGALRYMNEFNHLDENSAEFSTDFDGQWETVTFRSAEGAPMVRYTCVNNTPHTSFPEEFSRVWDEFFSKYSRGEDGTLYYEGAPVSAGAFAQSDVWMK